MHLYLTIKIALSTFHNNYIFFILEPGSNQINSFDSVVAKRAIVRCTNIIVKSSIDPSALALELYSEEIISDGLYKRVRDKKTGDSSEDRLELILDDIKDRVSQNGNILTPFLNILKELAHQHLADTIVKKYKGMLYRILYYMY